jgi:hypothetical protein
MRAARLMGAFFSYKKNFLFYTCVCLSSRKKKLRMEIHAQLETEANLVQASAVT